MSKNSWNPFKEVWLAYGALGYGSATLAALVAWFMVLILFSL